MNLTWKNRLIRLEVVMLITLSIISCNKDTNFDNKIYFSQGVKSNIIPLTLDNGVGTIDLSLVSALIAEKNLDANISILSNDYLIEYNKNHATNFVAVPDSAITIAKKSLSIIKGKARSDENLTVSIKDWKGFVEGTQYAVPIKLISNGETGVLPGSDIIILSINKIITTTVANTSSGFTANALNIYGKDKPLDNITVEGKFLLTKNLAVPGNWRSDVFYGFGMQFVVTSGGGIEIRLPNSAFIFNENSPVSTTINTWVHFAITYKNSEISLFINGDQAGSSYKYSNLPVDGISIAEYTSGINLSEFKIWNHVRTRQQIKTFACAVDPKTSGLLAYWKFNEGSGDIVKDFTANNHVLTPVKPFNWVQGVKCP